jgi:two-component system, LytTR family, sensor kinase
MSELLNLVGLSAGVVLYTVLLVMVLRTAPRPVGAAPFDPLLLGTAILGLTWNLCALPAYELPKVGFGGPFPFLSAVGFSALGFLPAVVVHSVMRGRGAGLESAAQRTLVAIAYGVSTVAAAMHLESAWTAAPVPSVLAMRALTYTFIALVVPVAVVARGQPGARRALWVAALATFAVSAMHLSNLHSGDASWPVELLGHHASLPLAFAILYQDYPFALADLFLKRALALLALLAIAFTAIALLGGYSPVFAQFDPRQVGLLVTLWVATALLYPTLRRSTAWFVDAIVLRRPDYRSLRASVTRRVQAHDDVEALLADLCDQLRPALSAQRVEWQEWMDAPEDHAGVVTQGDGLLVMIATAEAPRYAIAIGDVTGGRRFLSDDVATLDALAAVAARRIDAIRITHERYERELRDQEMEKLATEAELRALRAQLNPHFLFNALTTIGHLIQAAPPRALDTLLRLTALLRAVLRSEGELTTLGREMEMVAAYLDIERARFEWRLRTQLDVPPALAALRVPPLLLQPLVENAVKHGISKLRDGGEVRVCARVQRPDGDVPELVLTVSDTGAGAHPDELRRGRVLGVGLQNVERRLACQYGTAAALTIQTAPNVGTTVTIRLPVPRNPSAEAAAALQETAR